MTLYGCDAFAHMRQALTSHPESVMVLVSCIFYADGLLRGVHTALAAAKCIDARLSKYVDIILLAEERGQFFCFLPPE